LRGTVGVATVRGRGYRLRAIELRGVTGKDSRGEPDVYGGWSSDDSLTAFAVSGREFNDGKITRSNILGTQLSIEVTPRRVGPE
jgi:hypothetical protein